jgi:predicted PurR-regulated permease PerM
MDTTIQSYSNKASYAFMIAFLGICFAFHLMPSLIAGMVVFILIGKVFNFFNPLVKSKIAHKITLGVVVLVIALLMGGLFSAAYYGFKMGNGGMHKLGEDIVNILQQIKHYLPTPLVDYIPDDVLVLKEQVMDAAKENSPHLFEMTTHSAKVFVHVIIGILIGAVTAFSFLNYKNQEHVPLKPLSEALMKRVVNFGLVFERVIFAQGKISAINTALTAIYLLIVLPLCGIHMPYANVLIVFTFCVGLVPVVGNLISNFIIVLISLTVSFQVAIASLGFLIVIHKLEYYVNAKIVGHEIKTSIWEMLIIMVLMETIFGLIGVAVAPIIYGYIKEELEQKGLI